MSMKQLLSEKRLLLKAELTPVQGERFQPTGFPELGPALYTLPDGTEMLLLESAQSVANRLESVCWDGASKSLVAPLQGMPYVSVQYEGRELTNSLLEAHRLSSSYILGNPDTDFFEVLQQELSGLALGPIDERALAAVVMKYDPNAVLHGVFFARKELAGGRLRLPRLISGFIEARDVRPVESGGVKNDRVEPRASAKLGFGNVPYARTEYTAAAIEAYFNLDIQRLRSYQLPEPAEMFLLHLALWKMAAFLAQGLRLRTACDLKVRGPLTADTPAGFSMPDLGILDEIMPAMIAAVEGFTNPPVTVINFDPPKGWLKEKDTADEEIL